MGYEPTKESQVPQPSWTIESPSLHRGLVPGVILPGGGFDLVFSLGDPLPTPWGDDTILISVSRVAPIELGVVETEALRIPLQERLIEQFDPGSVVGPDGNRRASRKLREYFAPAWRGDGFDADTVIEIVESGVRQCGRGLRRRIESSKEIVSALFLDPDARSVASWSRCCGVRPKTLQRMVSSVYGFSPRTLLRICRINRFAAATQGEESLGEIAHRLGFTDQSHLSHEASALTGLTPSRLRRRVRMGEVLVRRPSGELTEPASRSQEAIG